MSDPDNEPVRLTAEERAALVVRIDGAQSVVRIPRYKELLASARAKLVRRPRSPYVPPWLEGDAD